MRCRPSAPSSRCPTCSDRSRSRRQFTVRSKAKSNSPSPGERTPAVRCRSTGWRRPTTSFDACISGPRSRRGCVASTRRCSRLQVSCPLAFLPVLAVFVLVQAEALRTLLRAEAPIEQRLAVIVAWQFVTFVLLRALREAVLMPKARAFFSSLPIRSLRPNFSPISRSLCRDTRSSGRRLAGWHYTTQTFQAWLSLGVLVVASLCANLALLRARPWHSLPALAALLTLALPPGPRFCSARPPWRVSRSGVPIYPAAFARRSRRARVTLLNACRSAAAWRCPFSRTTCDPMC